MIYCIVLYRVIEMGKKKKLKKLTNWEGEWGGGAIMWAIEGPKTNVKWKR